MSFIESLAFYEGPSSFPAQMHIDCELLIVTDGYITVNSCGNDYIVSKGQMCLIPSGVVHATRTDCPDYKRWVMFINTWEFYIAYNSPLLQNIITAQSLTAPLVIDTDSAVLSIISEMYAEYNSQQLLHDSMLCAGTIQILTRFARKATTPAAAEITDGKKLVLEIQAYLHRNCSEGLRISDVASKFYISTCYLSHIFKEQTNMSPKQFMMNCRLVKAGHLLTGTQLSAAEIAESCGFVSPSDMAARFKKEYGMTPKEYRVHTRNSLCG